MHYNPNTRINFEKNRFFSLKHHMCSKHFIFYMLHIQNGFDHLKGIYNLLQRQITNFLQTFLAVAKQTSE